MGGGWLLVIAGWFRVYDWGRYTVVKYAEGTDWPSRSEWMVAWEQDR